ncbi:MAG: DUF4321 domain-containing protein [Clostridia bacterium]|nr:DUF4321 domain-containing protein [Clostridia bacterium]
MRRTSGRRTGRLLLLILCGILIGSILGHILSLFIDHPILTHTIQFGMEDPITLNLTAFTIVLGFSTKINFGTVVGIIIGLFLYFRS